jgi:hypothetical protein
MATRCRCPPDSSCGNRVAKSSAGETHLLERVLYEKLPLGPRRDRMDDERLGHRRGYAETRVERLVRILVDDLHPSPQCPKVTLRETHDVHAVEGDAARLRPDEPQDRLRGGGLAAAGLADERNHLTARDRQRDTGHGVDVLLGATQDGPTETPGDAIADNQVLDLEQWSPVAFEPAHAATPTELAK